MASINQRTLKELFVEQQIYEELIDNNVNLVSGLATNYLNHYIEIFLLLEILPDMPECFEDIRLWRPISYCDHVMQSKLPSNEIVLRAYEAVDEKRKTQLASIAKRIDHGLQSFIARAGAALDCSDQDMLRTIRAESNRFLTPLIEEMTGVITPSGIKTSPFVDHF